MTRRALLLAACAVFGAGSAAAAPRRKIYRVKRRKPPATALATAEPASKIVRTIRLDADGQPYPTFEQRWEQINGR